jgi:AcrR family transcriptional regulator
VGQQKKEHVRLAILDSATVLFSKRGYAETTLAEIAKGAKISTANIYIYFDSKLEILYAIYDPWIHQRLLRLESEIANLSDSKSKLRRLLKTLWIDLPSEKTGLVNNIMQALSTASPVDNYKPKTLNWTVRKLDTILQECLPPGRKARIERARIGYLLLMAYDGFAIYRHVHPRGRPDKEMIETVISMLLGDS